MRLLVLKRYSNTALHLDLRVDETLDVATDLGEFLQRDAPGCFAACLELEHTDGQAVAQLQLPGMTGPAPAAAIAARDRIRRVPSRARRGTGR